MAPSGPPGGAGATLTRILHPCVLLSGAGARVLVDPCFGSFTRRALTSRIFGIGMPPPGLRPGDLRGLSAIAITHGHEDHFDEVGMAGLPGRDCPVITGDPRLARRVRRLGFRDVRIAAPWESHRGAGWEITAAPARSPNAPREISFVVSLGSLRVFHGGDTAAHGAFGEIGRRLAPRAACLPVNGVSLLGVRLTMTPAQAARAAAALGVTLAVPIHHEMEFHRVSRLLYRARGTAALFRRELDRLAPAIRVALPARGEPLSLEGLP